MENEDVALLLLLRRRRKKREKRRMWVHPTLKLRKEHGEFHRLIQELRDHPDRFYTYFRMSPPLFDDLLEKVGPHIRRLDTNYREAISPSERLAITLR